MSLHITVEKGNCAKNSHFYWEETKQERLRLQNLRNCQSFAHCRAEHTHTHVCLLEGVTLNRESTGYPAFNITSGLQNETCRFTCTQPTLRTLHITLQYKILCCLCSHFDLWAHFHIWSPLLNIHPKYISWMCLCFLFLSLLFNRLFDINPIFTGLGHSECFKGLWLTSLKYTQTDI